MTRDEAVTRMRRDLAFNNSLNAATLIDALKDAQISLENEPELPFFLRTEVSSILTVAREERAQLPTDFPTIVGDDPVWFSDSIAD